MQYVLAQEATQDLDDILDYFLSVKISSILLIASGSNKQPPSILSSASIFCGGILSIITIIIHEYITNF